MPCLTQHRGSRALSNTMTAVPCNTIQGQLCPVSHNTGAAVPCLTTQGQPCLVSHKDSHVSHKDSHALSNTTQSSHALSHNTKTCTVPYNTKMTIHCPMQHKDSCAMSHITQRQPCTVPHNTMKTSMCCPTQRNAKSHARSHITRTQPCTDQHNTSRRQSYLVQHLSLIHI